MRKFIVFIFSLLFLTNLFAVEIDFPVAGLLVPPEKNVKINLDWDEKWFFESSFKYNHSLARMAGYFSEISYADVLDDPDTNAIAQAYNLIGIKKEDMEFYYNLDYTRPVYGVNQVAYSMATKEIKFNGQKKNLVILVIRGTPFDADEWISNLKIDGNGDGKTFMHEGFATSTSQVYTDLIYHLLEKKFDLENTCFFITGHSRGAAVANLLGKKLHDQNSFKNENIFIYTVACPNSIQTEDEIDEEEYGFIWNIVNGEDFVPSLPPNRGEWHFKKYGHTLVLVNAWNVDQKIYDEKYFPSVNEIFSRMMDKNYVSMRTGPFLQTQFSRIVTNTYKTLDDYYKGFLSLPKQTVKLIKNIFPKGEKFELDQAFDIGLLSTAVRFVSNGTYNYFGDFLANMHSAELYFSYLVALDENEIYSDQGFSQLILDGFYDCAIFDENENRLLQIFDGTIQYDQTKNPLAAMPVSGKKIAIGYPSNKKFTVVVNKSSLIPSMVSCCIENYDAQGHLLNQEEKNNIHPHLDGGYKFYVGSNLESEKISFEKISGNDLNEWMCKGELKHQEKFVVKPELSYDIDNQLWLGVHLGCKNIYGSLFTMQPMNNFGSIFELSPGIGHQNECFANILLSTELMSRLIYVFEDVEGRGWNFVPSLKLSLKFQPRNRFEMQVSGIFDFQIKGFNDGAFDPAVRKNVMGNLDLKDKVKIIPTISFGARF